MAAKKKTDPVTESAAESQPVMRAKLRLHSVEEKFHLADEGKPREKAFEVLSFTAVGPDGSYDESGLDEDNSYAKWTPQADLSMTVNNPALWGQLQKGDKFYADFTRADAAPAAES